MKEMSCRTKQWGINEIQIEVDEKDVVEWNTKQDAYKKYSVECQRNIIENRERQGNLDFT
jgi:hypothetical protein